MSLNYQDKASAAIAATLLVLAVLGGVAIGFGIGHSVARNAEHTKAIEAGVGQYNPTSAAFEFKTARTP